VGTLVTLDLADDSPVLSLPWIITFGPAEDDDAWEPVVCGPYERAHALALAETVIADDEELMAVVEPLLPHSSVDEILAEINIAKVHAEEDEEEYGFDDGGVNELGVSNDVEVSVDDDFDEHDHDHDEFDEDDDFPEVEPTAPPSPEEVRAGFARIAARLSAGL